MPRALIAAVLVLVTAAPARHENVSSGMRVEVSAPLRDTADAGHAGIEAFNRRLDEATRHMDNEATLALWEDDGVSLLPQTKSIAGKAALRAFLTDVTARFPGAHMETFTMQCSGIETAGAWGSEWCVEHQVVRLADGTTFDGRGTMLLVLHRGRDGVWRMSREMWNQGGDGAGDYHG